VVRAGEVLIELKKRIESAGGLWLQALKERGINQVWEWSCRQFAEDPKKGGIPEDDRGIYLRRHRFSVKKAALDYRKTNGLSRPEEDEGRPGSRGRYSSRE